MKSSASFSVKNRPFADQREAKLEVNTRSFTRQIGNQKFGSPYCFKDSMSDLSRVFNIIGANSANVKSRALLLNRTLHILKLRFFRIDRHEDECGARLYANCGRAG